MACQPGPSGGSAEGLCEAVGVLGRSVSDFVAAVFLELKGAVLLSVFSSQYLPAAVLTVGLTNDLSVACGMLLAPSSLFSS